MYRTVTDKNGKSKLLLVFLVLLFFCCCFCFVDTKANIKETSKVSQLASKFHNKLISNPSFLGAFASCLNNLDRCNELFITAVNEAC